jgi:SAM-dependent methyltransferase
VINEFFLQNQWLGIKFSELPIDLKLEELPTAEFYSAFYRHLDQKYIDLCELPSQWLNIKLNTAKLLSQLIPAGSRVFSYGCGLGIVEKYLIENYGVDEIVGFDFASSSKISYKNKNFQIVTSTEEMPLEKFDVIYASQVIYALDDLEVINLLTLLSNKMKHNGKLIISHSSIKSEENGMVLPKISLRTRLCSKITNTARRLPVSSNKKSKSQGWGYIRDNELVEFLAKSAGFKEMIFICAAGQSFLVCSSKLNTQP